jgi:hypothetical protein
LALAEGWKNLPLAEPLAPMPPHFLAIVSTIYVLGAGTKGTYSYVPGMAMGGVFASNLFMLQAKRLTMVTRFLRRGLHLENTCDQQNPR